MSEECNHNCAECAKKKEGSCGKPESFRVPANKDSNIKKVISVMSGKGGVG